MAVESERHKWEEEKSAEERKWSVVSVPVIAPSNYEQLRPNEHRAVGNVNNTANMRMVNQVFTYN